MEKVNYVEIAKQIESASEEFSGEIVEFMKQKIDTKYSRKFGGKAMMIAAIVVSTIQKVSKKIIGE